MLRLVATIVAVFSELLRLGSLYFRSSSAILTSLGRRTLTRGTDRLNGPLAGAGGQAASLTIATKRAILLLLTLIVLPAWAQSDSAAELARLRAELSRIQQEQQSVFQQFQMLQQLRSSELEAQNPQVTVNPPVYPDGEPPSYDDMVRARQEREDRIKEYEAKLKQLEARYKELEDAKKPLFDRVQKLTGQQ